MPDGIDTFGGNDWQGALVTRRRGHAGHRWPTTDERPATGLLECGATEIWGEFNSGPGDGGAEGNRTPDLLNAIQALSQLSYGPARWRQGV
jgi:hypothetical protein